MKHKRRFASLTAALIAVVCAALIPTRAHATTCDARTIAGNYGFRVHELSLDPAPSGRIAIGNFVPAAFVGQMVFNPAAGTNPATGTVTGFRIGNKGGVPLTNADAFNTPTDQSTYSVDADCTGTLTLVLEDGSARTYQIAIAQGGAEIELAAATASFAVVSDGVAKKQPAACDATTIAGNFAVRFNRILAPNGQISGHTFDLGAFTPADSAGLLQFDATTTPPSVTGHLIGITDGTSSFATSLTGSTYSVNANCTGTLSIFDNEGLTKELGMTIVEDGAGIEIEFANTTQPGSQIVGEGVAKKQ